MPAHIGLAAWLIAWLSLAQVMPVHAALDREKLLNDPGVYGTFAVFKVGGDWWKLDRAARTAAASDAKAVFQNHAETLAVDTYLLRGLSDQADFFLRIHATDLLKSQQFLLDLMGTSLGKHLTNTYTLNGLTKTANYVPGFPDQMKAALKIPSGPGPKPYAIVIPIRKDTDWWRLDQQARTDLMKEHTEASLPYVKTVKRKLYHATGIEDADFITYFETANLEDFQGLILALDKVQETRHLRRFGHPTLLGTIRPLDEILDILTR